MIPLWELSHKGIHLGRNIHQGEDGAIASIRPGDQRRVRKELLHHVNLVTDLDGGGYIASQRLGDIIRHRSQRLGTRPLAVLGSQHRDANRVLGDQQDGVVVLGGQQDRIAGGEGRGGGPVGVRPGHQHRCARRRGADGVEPVDLALADMVRQQKVLLPDTREPSESGIGGIRQDRGVRQVPGRQVFSVLVHPHDGPRVRAHHVDVLIPVVFDILKAAEKSVCYLGCDIVLPEDLLVIKVVLDDDVGA